MAILIYNVDSSAICVIATIVLRFNVIIIIILFKLSGRGRLHNSSLIQGRRGFFLVLRKIKLLVEVHFLYLEHFVSIITVKKHNIVKT